MDKRAKRKHSGRRKRIQLDDHEEKSADGQQVLSSNDGQSSKQKRSGKSSLPSTTSTADKDRTNKVTPPGSPTQTTPPGSPTRTGGASPEPNCPICLGKLENKSFTDSCFHQFCYVCLLEWSKVKAECPLCKQTFKSIIHNVKSYKDYDQYHIPRPEDRDPFDLFAPGGRRFRYRTTVTDHRYFRSLFGDELQHQLGVRLDEESLQRPSRRRYPLSNHRAWRRLRQAATSAFRRGIYHNGLKVKESTGTRRRLRETSPSFFRENTACTHRLVPWLNRELNAVLEGREDRVAYVLDLIMGLIKRYHIDSEEFYQHVYPIIGRHTRHFMHEFLMFAKSPYHMAAYDQHANYEPTSEYDNNQSETETIHHSDGNESDVVIVSPVGPQNDQRSRPAIENAPERIQPTDTNLLPWESSIISMAQPSYSYFNPVMPSFPSLLSTQHNSTITSSLPSTSGWDSPISGPSWTMDNHSFDSASEIDVMNVSLPTSSLASGTASSSTSSFQPLDLRICGNSSASSQDSVYRNFIESLNLISAAGTSTQAPSSTISAEPTSKLNPVVCSDSDSESDAVMIVDYEKPWLERSPIHLSSDNSSDCDIMITGVSNMAPDGRIKKLKKGKERESIIESEEPLSQSECIQRPSKKRKHRSRSKSLPRQYRKRISSHSSDNEGLSRSRSPLLLRLHVPPYKDKFSKHYRKEKENLKHRSDRKHSGSHRSDSHSSSRSKYRKRSLSSSSSDGEHVSFQSHKHKSRSGMEIMEYFKKRVKRKKHRKSKHRSRSPCDLSELYHHKKKKKHKERLSSKDRDRKHKHKSRHDRLLPTDSLHKNRVIPATGQLNIDQVCASLNTFLPRNMDHMSNVSTIPSELGINNSITSTDANKSQDQVDQVNTALVSSRLEKDKGTGNKIIQKEDDSNMAKSSAGEDILGTSNELEFVEMLPSQAGLFDRELESLSQLFPDLTSTTSMLDSVKTFKKHPHGHKSSSKTKTSTFVSDDNLQGFDVNSSCERKGSVSETLSNPTTVRINEPGDIQLNTITSCTDPEADEPLQIDIDEKLTELNTNLDIANASSNSTVAIPSTVLEIEHSDGELIDVEGQSDGSDVDVLNITDAKSSFLSVPAYIRSGSSVNICDNAHDIDSSKNIDNTKAEHVSDSNTDITVAGDHDIHLDVEGISDSGSDTIQFGGVELSTNKEQSICIDKEIDITGISDSETVRYLSETNDADKDSSSDIDVLTVPSEDIIIEPDNAVTPNDDQSTDQKSVSKSSKTLFLDSDSEGIDLDYQCEHLEEIDVAPKYYSMTGIVTQERASNEESKKNKVEKVIENVETDKETADANLFDPKSDSMPDKSDSNAPFTNSNSLDGKEHANFSGSSECTSESDSDAGIT